MRFLALASCGSLLTLAACSSDQGVNSTVEPPKPVGDDPPRVDAQGLEEVEISGPVSSPEAGAADPLTRSNGLTGLSTERTRSPLSVRNTPIQTTPTSQVLRARLEQLKAQRGRVVVRSQPQPIQAQGNQPGPSPATDQATTQAVPQPQDSGATPQDNAPSNGIRREILSTAPPVVTSLPAPEQPSPGSPTLSGPGSWVAPAQPAGAEGINQPTPDTHAVPTQTPYLSQPRPAATFHHHRSSSQGGGGVPVLNSHSSQDLTALDLSAQENTTTSRLSHSRVHQSAGANSDPEPTRLVAGRSALSSNGSPISPLVSSTPTLTSAPAETGREPSANTGREPSSNIGLGTENETSGRTRLSGHNVASAQAALPTSGSGATHRATAASLHHQSVVNLRPQLTASIDTEQPRFSQTQLHPGAVPSPRLHGANSPSTSSTTTARAEPAIASPLFQAEAPQAASSDSPSRLSPDKTPSQSQEILIHLSADSEANADLNRPDSLSLASTDRDIDFADFSLAAIAAGGGQFVPNPLTQDGKGMVDFSGKLKLSPEVFLLSQIWAGATSTDETTPIGESSAEMRRELSVACLRYLLNQGSAAEIGGGEPSGRLSKTNSSPSKPICEL